MKKYLGVKIVEAEFQEVPETFGFIGEHSEEREAYKVIYPDGYTSWSPKEVFEKAYRAIDGLTFGLAIEALKQDKKVARTGWNGKGMWLTLMGPQGGRVDLGIDGIFEGLPWIGMKTADEKFVPWLASQTDMLAEDWQIVE